MASQSKPHFLIDGQFSRIYASQLLPITESGRAIVVEASEQTKSFDQLSPVFLALLQKGLRRDGSLVVIGGGVLQDIGCFVASVLSRGLRWELIPTTLLAQADSCIGSKSSINIGKYKNQIGTFYPPHRVLITSEVLSTLSRDEIRSGLGEVIKLQLLYGRPEFEELMLDLSTVSSANQSAVLSKWVFRSLSVKKPYIEADEHDRGVRNLLNYGHTFGHAYESATHYQIPHGIAVLLGILTATFLSHRLGLATVQHYTELKGHLRPWHDPYGKLLVNCNRADIFDAIRRDKKNTADAINCILTRGPGAMEKHKIDFHESLQPAINDFIEKELVS